ncbi:uncharacterized protein [Cherax quadricarinatus]|uniref:uncharacterized protein n=1 Tax=Cherax quadricarinatus TaxID=27406 RepID=UPI00387ECDEC
MLALLLVTVVVLGAPAEGVTSRERSPVRFYAGVRPTKKQAILIEPKLSSFPPHQALKVAAHGTQKTEESLAVSPFHTAGLNDKPATVALRRRPFVTPPGLYPNLLNRSGIVRERLQQQMQGRRAGSRRNVEGVSVDSSRLRPGIALPEAEDQLPLTRRLPMAPRTSQLKNSPGQMTNQGALRNPTAHSSAPHSKVDDFLSEWHNSYSRSQAKEQDFTTGNQELATEVRIKTENLNNPAGPTSTPESGHGSSGAVSTTKRISNSPQILEHISTSTPPASVPSVHDMTSMHFKNASLRKVAGVQRVTGNAKETKYPELQSSRSTGNTVYPSAAASATLFSTRNSGKVKVSPDGKEILDSIQSIFEAASTDERQLSFVKNTNHGNTSPQSLDIFSGIFPSYGFQPSHQTQLQHERKADTHVQLIQTSHSDPQAIGKSVSLITKKSHGPGMETQASNLIGRRVLASQRGAEKDMFLRVGQTLPVKGQDWGPEHRESTEGDTILEEGPANGVIIGRPEALIQAPLEETPVLITTVSPPQRHYGTSVYSHNTEDSATQRTHEKFSYSPWHPEEMDPLLAFVNTKYKPQHMNSKSSVTSLQSMINAGRISEVFRRDQVMDIISKDSRKQEQHFVNRVGKPWTNTLERTQTQLKVKDEASRGGQFVALSSIALLLAFCGYFLYTGSGAKEARKVLHPLKTAVEDARNGLHVLLRGLDEYEDHLNHEDAQSKKLEPLQDKEYQSTSQSDIPTILKRMWNTVVPPEVRVTSAIVTHDPEGYIPVNASDLVRSKKPRGRNNMNFRQSHTNRVPTDQMNNGNAEDLSQDEYNVSHNKSVVLTADGLSSFVNSFLNSVINSKTVERIISQLKSPLNAKQENNTMNKEEEQNNPAQNKPTSKLHDRPEDKHTNITNHDALRVNTTTNTAISSSHSTTNTSQTTTKTPEAQHSTQESVVISSGSGEHRQGVREVREQSSSSTDARKQVIINNKLHIRHDPETDPPRTSAFVNNVPLKPAS